MATGNISEMLEQADRYASSGDLENAWNQSQRMLIQDPKNEQVLTAATQHFESLTGMKIDPSARWNEDVWLPNLAVNQKDASAMILVPTGEFLMGTQVEAVSELVMKYEEYGANFQWFTPELPQRRVELHSFYVGKYAATSAQYAEFLNQADPSKEELNTYIFLTESTTLQLVDGKYQPRLELEKFPVNNITWTGADAYCKFMGLRLPREVEWEKASRGTDGREFPWGNENADETRARYSQRWKEKKFNVMVSVDGLPDGVGPYGTYNQAGNIWEWCQDEFSHPEPGAKYKVLRGGGWNFNPLLCRCPYRSVNKHDFRNSGYGFRPFRGI